MRHSVRSISLLVAAALLCIGWGSFAQVQEKAKSAPGTAPKKPPTAKPAEPARPARPAAASPAGSKTEKKAAPAAVTEIDDEAEIRRGAEAFVAAYNAHEAKGVSELLEPALVFDRCTLGDGRMGARLDLL